MPYQKNWKSVINSPNSVTTTIKINDSILFNGKQFINQNIKDIYTLYQKQTFTSPYIHKY